jgi:hypothetical protein
MSSFLGFVGSICLWHKLSEDITNTGKKKVSDAAEW